MTFFLNTILSRKKLNKDPRHICGCRLEESSADQSIGWNDPAPPRAWIRTKNKGQVVSQKQEKPWLFQESTQTRLKEQ